MTKKHFNCLTRNCIPVFIFVGFSTFIMSCKKDVSISAEIEKTVAIDSSKKEISIVELKRFMAKHADVDVDSVSYNAVKEQFIWRGKNQITKSDLLFAYKQSQL
ncbi:hypothetical protein [uncultured Pedobacter sp.]|uniref:hypothetical protein n=1 Tax=uncultured Pedobacter sp. TaxID=246139 RepID=UPI0025EDD053|nr:hypothetical protein [uncultured Pedobacter sp.]